MVAYLTSSKSALRAVCVWTATISLRSCCPARAMGIYGTQATPVFGIECTVINGITAGLAAVTSLGVPLTHRDHAQGVVFVTGHAKTGASAHEDATDWRALAATAHSARLTLVIYMGVAGAGHIERELLQGLPGDTPVAVIQHASLPQQRHVTATLERLQACIAEAGLASPAVIVVGDVLRGLAAAALPAGSDAGRFGT